MSETSLATVGQNMAPSLTKKDAEDIASSITGEMYSVGGTNRVPDSRVIQSLSNAKHLTTKIVSYHQDEKEASVVVECSDGQSTVQSVVNHIFSTVMQDKIVSMVKKELEKKKEKESFKNSKPYKSFCFNDLDNPFVVDENGSAIPNLTLQGQLKLVNDMTRFKTFAIRDADTKASKRAQMKILNQEWRDPEEIESEDDEVSKVNNNKAVKKESVINKNESKKVKKTVKKQKKETKSEPVDADFKTKEIKDPKEENPIEDMVASQKLEEIKKDLESKGFKTSKKAIKGHMKLMVKNEAIEFDEEMQSRVEALL
ncbi:MAG: hypothetical protein LBM02_08080 [Lachnospiraceae bacterium]|jgi:hypothetical protein|nr:hypothetical protein [Lachnospiraceae bacterium]